LLIRLLFFIFLSVGLFVVFILWFGISLPLIFVGNILARQKVPSPPPVAVNKIPRAIPQGSVYTGALFHILVGGMVSERKTRWNRGIGELEIFLFIFARALLFNPPFFFFLSFA
jgi:hypothetical protein